MLTAYARVEGTEYVAELRVTRIENAVQVLQLLGEARDHEGSCWLLLG